MRWRGLLVCTSVVVAVHGALIAAMASHEPPAASGTTPAAASRRPARLVLLDQEQVASLTPHDAAASAVEAPAARPEPPAAASTPDRRPAQPASTDSEADSHPQRPTTTIYRAPAQLDVPPRPRSAPDVSILNNLAWSGTPIRLRVFIDSQGQVVDTQVLQNGESDDVIALVRQVFLATGFTPGMQHGQAVPSYKDIEITVGTPH